MDDSPDASGVHDALPARTLGAIVEHAGDIQPVLKSDLDHGDWIVVVTKNSTYSICYLGGESYSVAGGWFDQNNSAPLTVSINGCTWGGSAIKSDILAAPGHHVVVGDSTVGTNRDTFRLPRRRSQYP